LSSDVQDGPFAERRAWVMQVVNSFVRARSAGTSTPVPRRATAHGPAVQEDGDEYAQINRSLVEQRP
jgi:hypothetical protein